ncbi:MAG: prepilin-type N-terminal cleavage/methylation domain-containing protein [Pirellulaceae bacterium]|nr:prepilin-type N-terminal cleavage/methylation domain-containing protein [Pirellulaceae bacterium]
MNRIHRPTRHNQSDRRGAIIARGRDVPRRQGYTFIEFTAAMVVLGVAMAGIYPLVVMQSRAIESLELRYADYENGVNSDKPWFAPIHRPYLEENITAEDREDYGVWYLKPDDDPWARKIGAAATLDRGEPEYPDDMSKDFIHDDDDNLEDDKYVEDSGSDWETVNDGYVEYPESAGDARLHEASTVQASATWTFDIDEMNIPIGYYHVYATWPANLGFPNTENAEFFIDNEENASIQVCQYNLPEDKDYKGCKWKWLTAANNPHCIDSNTSEVKVTVRAIEIEGDAGNYHPIVADAVWLERQENSVKVQSVQRFISTTESPEKTIVKVKVENN